MRSWSPKPAPPSSSASASANSGNSLNDKKEDQKEFETEYDDLNSFLDELEASNVLPSKIEKQINSKASEPKVIEKEIKVSKVPAVKAIKKDASVDKLDKIVVDKIKSDVHVDPSSLTVVALKEKLRAKGLPVSGAKADLIQRLASN